MKSLKFALPNRDRDDGFVVGERKLTCVVDGWSWQSLSGHLVDFDSAQQVIKVQAFASETPLRIKFNQIKSLRIEHQPDVDDEVTFALSSYESEAPKHYPFVVSLKDGSVYSGLAHAHRKTLDGLWIFPKKNLDGDPYRVFIPDFSIQSIGMTSDSDGGGVGVDGSSVAEFNGAVMAEVAAIDVSTALEYVVSGMIESPEQLRVALEQQTKLKPVPIGEALLGLGKITPEQLALALTRQKSKSALPLGQTLIEMGLLTPAELQTAFARKMGYPFVDLSKFPIDVTALRKVPFATASRLTVMPLQELRTALVVAMPDPLQFKIIEELEFCTQRKVIPVVTTSTDLHAQIAKAYRGMGLVDAHPSTEMVVSPDESSARGDDAFQLAVALSGEAQYSQADEEPIEQSDNTLVKLINSMITEAYYQRASDIHIEPYPGREKVAIRFRVDGELRPYLELPSGYRNALVARIKIMCDLDISERRKPQDGKIIFSKYGGVPIELRVATIPTTNGLEDVVMRLLASQKVVQMESLDLSPSNLLELGRMIERPYGLILTVGPTGSGKTTTLHSVLQRINKPNRKIWTAEDPVEITQRGLRQIQVNSKIDWTFAAALRSLLRADPDVIMVGEIRDQETAEMAIEASLTGHLVLSTLHTNSAVETIVRLNDLGVDPFSFSDSLQGILAQRLVRRWCSDCVRSSPIDDDRLDELLTDFTAPLPEGHMWRDRQTLHAHWLIRWGREGQLYDCHAPGCERCNHTGYRGRVAIHELLRTSPELRVLIQQRSHPQLIQTEAIAQGMLTLRQDGIEKVLMGLTSLAEVRASANV